MLDVPPKGVSLWGQLCNEKALHRYGERYMPRGHARCTRPVPGEKNKHPESYEYIGATKTLRVGAGAFAPIAPEA